MKLLQPANLLLFALLAAGTPVLPAQGKGLDVTELALWNDRSFRLQLAESYLAETEIEPRVTLVERDQLQQVFELISTNKLPEAMEMVRTMGGKDANAVFDFTLANLHFQQDQLDEAAAAYESAVEKFPKFRRAWKNLGIIHVRKAAFAKAARALARVVELGGSDATTWGLLGFAYSSTDNHLGAESAYRMANALDPAALDWKMGLARSFFKQKRFADAAALCAMLLEQNPGRADLWLLQANAYLGLGQPRKAAENYELVDGMGQSTADSLNTLGDIYVNEELFDQGVARYLQVLERFPASKPDRAMRAARVLAARGAVDEVEPLVARIEELRGAALGADEKKELLRLRARIAVAKGAGEEEARILQEIVTMDPLDGDALILLGQYASRTGDKEKAAFWFEQAAGIEAFEADAKVRHAQMLVGQGRYAEALPMLRRAQTLKPRENIQQYLEQVERVAQSR